jgi:hypothetical protein
VFLVAMASGLTTRVVLRHLCLQVFALLALLALVAAHAPSPPEARSSSSVPSPMDQEYLKRCCWPWLLTAYLTVPV